MDFADNSIGPPRRVRVGALARGFSGSVAAMLVLLAVAVVAAQVLALWAAWEGPGLTQVIMHVVSAVLAVLFQRFADRHTGRLAWVAGLTVLAVAAATLWFWWWA